MLRDRILSAAILLPVVVGLAWLGGPAYAGLVLVVAVLAVREGHSLMVALGWAPSLMLAVPFGLGIALHGLAGTELLWPAVPMLVVATSLWQLKQPSGRRSATAWAGTLALVLLIGPPTAHVLALRWLPNGFEWTLLILAAVWLNDSSAYVTGRWMGSHPMAPTLSPNKTWEGALAAAAVSTAGTLVAATPLGIPLPAAAVLSAQVAVLAPIGDLTVSYLKRQAGLKDSGQTIPGHGGILDRVDSLMFAVMGAYYVALLTQQ